ncbi:hypothetical protein AK812_SmicGene9819 [Symbiodinium microadriaticum]|uniref:Uncharacterized protein n=1 Tax=Symbiodinium microadriaticum TaxID=2951 RepID=A0A1Q9EHE7_SYMMI|nr:hypothetical protein AK812_SmicGene9819 [Symbiodinium microadriaticum]
MTRRAPEVPWSPSWSQLQQDADIRRSDLHLRLENSQLKGALSRELLQLSASLHGRHSSVSLQGIDFGEPLPLTLLVASILACIYILMYLKHLFVFFLRKKYIETSNRRWIHVKERERAPDFADCERQVTERFCCNATHKTVVRLFLIVIAATACGSYMLREGFFDAVKDKLYLAMVILMILQVIIAMAWTYIENRLKPFWRLYEVIWRLQAAVKSGPSAVLHFLSPAISEISVCTNQSQPRFPGLFSSGVLPAPAVDHMDASYPLKQEIFGSEPSRRGSADGSRASPAQSLLPFPRAAGRQMPVAIPHDPGKASHQASHVPAAAAEPQEPSAEGVMKDLDALQAMLSSLGSKPGHLLEAGS